MKESSFALVVILCVGSLVHSEKSLELSKPGGDVELKCPLEPPVNWAKGKAIVNPGNHYSVNAENGTLTIVKLLSGDLAGVYTCNNSVSSSEFVVIAAAVAKKFSDRSVVLTEGGKLDLKCSAWGYPAPTIQWFKVSTDGQAEVELTSNKRVVLADSEDGLRNGSLTITDISIDDYGTYKCVADNGHSYVLDTNSTVNSAAILVRVKDKFTPLWPFIGIIVEIIILLTIIVVYERRKSKQEDGDAVKDGGATAVVNSNDHKDDETVRARK